MATGDKAMRPRTTVLTRTYDAPRELVWRAMVEPEHIVHWYIGSEGWTVPFAESDPRQGGVFRIGMRSPDGAHEFVVTGTYPEYVFPERLVMLLDDGRPVTVTLAEEGGRTHLTMELTLENVYPEEHQREGWGTILRHLAEHVATLGRLVDVSIDIPAGKPVIRTRVVVAAPREAVWRATNDPALFARWWGPRGLANKVRAFDVRPGGRWAVDQVDAGGAVHAFRGEYREVKAPERAVVTFQYADYPAAVQTFTYREDGANTVMECEMVFPDIALRDGMVASGMEGGARESYERLGQVLATL